MAVSVLAGLALAGATASQALAQSTQAPPAKPAAAPSVSSDGELTSELAITYSYTHSSDNGFAVVDYNKGWQISAATHINNNIGVFVEMGDIYAPAVSKPVAVGSNSTVGGDVLSYGAGIRFETNHRDMVRPFADLFIGTGADQATPINNHFTVMEFGGGIDLALGHMAALRVEGSMPLFLYFGPVATGGRLQVGVVYTFGK